MKIETPRTLYGRRYIFEQGMIIRALDDTASALARIVPERYLISWIAFPFPGFKQATLARLEKARERLDRLIAGESKPEEKGEL